MKKKIHTRQLTRKKHLCYGLPAARKFPTPHFLMGRPLVMAKSTFERTGFSHTSPAKNIPLFSHDGVQLRDVCWTSDTIYYTRQVDELEKTLVSFFMWIVSRNPLERGEIENQDFKNVLPWEP